MKKTIHHITGLCAFALGVTLATGVRAADGQDKNKDHGAATASKSTGELIKVGAKDAAWAAKARAEYPLKVCVASDEKLGSMGDNAEFIYREKGKPDRLIVFCCDGCEDDFKKDPAKYLAKLDAAKKKTGK
jgi:hypothetical protein